MRSHSRVERSGLRGRKAVEPEVVNLSPANRDANFGMQSPRCLRKFISNFSIPPTTRINGEAKSRYKLGIRLARVLLRQTASGGEQCHRRSLSPTKRSRAKSTSWLTQWSKATRTQERFKNRFGAGGS